MLERHDTIPGIHQYSRRTLGQALFAKGTELLAQHAAKATIVTGTAALVAARAGFQLHTEQLGFYDETVSDKYKEALGQYEAITIAHRGGNSPKLIDKSAQAGVNFVEADLRLFRGRPVVGHERYIANFLAVDGGTRLFRIGPKFTLEDILFHLQEIPLKARPQLFFEFKPEFTFHAVDKALRTVHASSVKAMYHSKNWDVLDYARKSYGSDSDYFYVPKNTNDMVRLLREQNTERRAGVLTSAGAAMRYMRDLKSADVTVLTNAFTPADALHLRRQGVNGFISDNLSLLQAFASKPKV